MNLVLFGSSVPQQSVFRRIVALRPWQTFKGLTKVSPAPESRFLLYDSQKIRLLGYMVGQFLIHNYLAIFGLFALAYTGVFQFGPKPSGKFGQKMIVLGPPLCLTQKIIS